MTIEMVAKNLRQTIAGKEQSMEDYNKALNVLIDPIDIDERSAIIATIEFLKINIAELNRILADVERCIPKQPEVSDEDDDDTSACILAGR